MNFIDLNNSYIPIEDEVIGMLNERDGAADNELLPSLTLPMSSQFFVGYIHFNFIYVI